MPDLDATMEDMLGGGEPEPAAEPEAPPESTPAKLAELDAVVPEDPDIDPEFWGKPIRDMTRVAKQHKHEAGIAATRNQQWNQMQAERDAARLALEYLKQQQGQAAQAPPPKPNETQDEYLQRLAAQPQQVINDEVEQRIAPVVQRLTQTESTLTRTLADLAQVQARESLGIDAQTWTELRGPVATFMAYQQWPANDPNAWAEATKIYVSHAMRTAQRFAPPAPVPQQAVELPRPGAPPNGAARSQQRPGNAPKLRPGLKSELDVIAKELGLDDKRRANLEQFAADNIGGLV